MNQNIQMIQLLSIIVKRVFRIIKRDIYENRKTVMNVFN